MINFISRIALFLAITLSVGVPAYSSYIIPNGAVTTAKIADSNVTTAKIADGAVTPAKLSARTNAGSTAGLGHVAVSSSSGSYTTSSASFTTVTNLSVTLTTSGRPVKVFLAPLDSAGSGYIGVANNSVTGCQMRGIFRRASTQISGEMRLEGYCSPSAPSVTPSIPVSAFEMTDFPSSGTHTYDFQVRLVTGNLVSVLSAYLVAYEI